MKKIIFFLILISIFLIFNVNAINLNITPNTYAFHSCTNEGNKSLVYVTSNNYNYGCWQYGVNTADVTLYNNGEIRGNETTTYAGNSFNDVILDLNQSYIFLNSTTSGEFSFNTSIGNVGLCLLDSNYIPVWSNDGGTTGYYCKDVYGGVTTTTNTNFKFIPKNASIYLKWNDIRYLMITIGRGSAGTVTGYFRDLRFFNLSSAMSNNLPIGNFTINTTDCFNSSIINNPVHLIINVSDSESDTIYYSMKTFSENKYYTYFTDFFYNDFEGICKLDYTAYNNNFFSNYSIASEFNNFQQDLQPYNIYLIDNPYNDVCNGYVKISNVINNLYYKTPYPFTDYFYYGMVFYFPKNETTLNIISRDSMQNIIINVSFNQDNLGNLTVLYLGNIIYNANHNNLYDLQFYEGYNSTTGNLSFYFTDNGLVKYDTEFSKTFSNFNYFDLQTEKIGLVSSVFYPKFWLLDLFGIQGKGITYTQAWTTIKPTINYENSSGHKIYTLYVTDDIHKDFLGGYNTYIKDFYFPTCEESKNDLEKIIGNTDSTKPSLSNLGFLFKTSMKSVCTVFNIIPQLVGNVGGNSNFAQVDLCYWLAWLIFFIDIIIAGILTGFIINIIHDSSFAFGIFGVINTLLFITSMFFVDFNILQKFIVMFIFAFAMINFIFGIFNPQNAGNNGNGSV